jgi:hypothetical protein
MASVTYNIIHPEEFQAFVPEVVKERRDKAARVILLSVGAVLLCLVAYTLYEDYLERKMDKQVA